MSKKNIAKIVFAAALLSTAKYNAQNTLSGNVKSEKGEAIPFAVVGIKNTQLAATSNSQGEFKFKDLKNSTYVLITKCLGYSDKVDTITVINDTQYEPVLSLSNKQLDEIVVNATRVDKDNGMAYSNIDSETLKKHNLGQDAPYMLNNLAGVVVNSDAGNGVGYTGLRIRGSDGTRINVTINGVPVNDAESHGTFFVNMPDLVSSTNNIQVQRGVGASSKGASAFGASINFQTNSLNSKPYANIMSTAGAFNTYRNTVAVGTGLLNDKFIFDARASKINSDGYIDRASSDLKSYYISAGYYGKKSVLKFINFYGQEKTYQAWNYVPEDSIRKGNRTYNSCGQYYDANGKIQYYANETDNYKQNNFQLHFIHQVNSRFNFNLTGHYTKGVGYYEQYKEDQSFSKYNMQTPVLHVNDSTPLTIGSTDLIRTLGLDNDFAGGIFNMNFIPGSKLVFTLGGGYSTYFGKHIDRVIWARYASNSEVNHIYDYNTGNKNDANVYLKTNYKPISNLNIFMDLQMRKVEHRFLGFNDLLIEEIQTESYTFFNPKAGISYDGNSKLNVYASLAVGNKEPNRKDFIQSTPTSRPNPEQMTDLEAGIKYQLKKTYFGVNIYNMQYKDQLVLNGTINNVGAYNRINVKSSYRRGIEIEVDHKFGRYVSLGGNIALSENKIVNFTDFIDSSDVNNTITKQYKKEYKNTDISFSPNIVSAIILAVKPFKGMEIALTNKYVGRQYLDNTGNSTRSINPYNVLDVRIGYTVKTNVIPEITFMLTVYNILDQRYETTGFTEKSYTGPTLNSANYLAPAASVNFLGGISLKF